MIQIIALACALAVLTAPASNAERFKDKIYRQHQLKLRGDEALCLHRKDNLLRMQPCVRSKDQVWFMTNRGELRNANRPNHCVTEGTVTVRKRVPGTTGLRARFRNVTYAAPVLEPCGMGQGVLIEVPDDQRWHRLGLNGLQRDIASTPPFFPDGQCVTALHKVSGSLVVLNPCADTDSSERRVMSGPLFRELTNKRLQDMQVGAHANCGRGCRLFMAGQRYGYRVGIQTLEDYESLDLLDLDERYSVDRCALAHDRNWRKTSAKSDDSNFNARIALFRANAIGACNKKGSQRQRQLCIAGIRSDVESYASSMDWLHFMHCLKRVRPYSRNEATAKRRAANFARFAIKDRFEWIGDVSTPYEDWGVLGPREARSNHANEDASETCYPDVATGSMRGCR